jgi:mono/diheme cytochrome c family protein
MDAFATSLLEEDVMLKSFLLLCAAILVTLTPMQALAAGAQDATPPAVAPTATNPVKPTADSQAKAKNLYQIDCAMCHGDNGNGKTDLAKSMGVTLADFTDPKTLAGMSDGELFNLIRSGKGEKMPPEQAGRANDTLLWNVIIYLRHMSKP